MIRDVLKGIAADERRHALLAWRFVAWIVKNDPALGRVLQSEIERSALGTDEAHSVQPFSAAQRAHGALDDTVAERIQREAIEHLIRPSVRALLDAAGFVGENSAATARL